MSFQLSEALALCEDRGFLFNSTCEHGRIEVDSQLSDLIADIGKKAKVRVDLRRETRYATAKHFRSSLATRRSMNGVPIDRVQSILRHASRATTEKHYIAPFGNADAADASRCNQSATTPEDRLQERS